MTQSTDFQFLTTAEMVERYEHLQNEYARLIEKANELARAKGTLLRTVEYYANPVNHYRIDRYDESPVMIDEGAVARRALEGINVGQTVRT